MNFIFDIEKKVVGYDNIGFDLDDTLYRQSDYDFLIYQSFFSRQYPASKAEELAFKLVELKKIKGYGYPCLFDDFFELNSIKSDVKELISFYRHPPAVCLDDKLMMRELLELFVRMRKNLFLISNGYFEVQMNKLLALDAKKYFNRIQILSPENSDLALKPSSQVKGLFEFEGSTIYLGDQSLDAEFACNCGYDFCLINLYE